MVEPEREELDVEEEEEFVLLDLESISDHISILPNTPYVLSGLDTANPILLIDNKLKLIGEYEETIGICLVFRENDGGPLVREVVVGPSDAKQTPAKQINPMAQLNKILKFKLFSESSEDGREKRAEKPS